MPNMNLRILYLSSILLDKIDSQNQHDLIIINVRIRILISCASNCYVFIFCHPIVLKNQNFFHSELFSMLLGEKNHLLGKTPKPQKFHHTLLRDLPPVPDLESLDLVGMEQFEHSIFTDFQNFLTFFQCHHFGYLFVHKFSYPF